MKTHDGPHDGTHDDCFGCKVKHIQVDQGVMATRSPSKKLRPMADPSWEKGIAGEQRPGGFMPYLNAKLDPIRVKEWGEIRSKVESASKSHVTTTGKG